eukprot:6074555-Prymnesium_polylepis.1
MMLSSPQCVSQRVGGEHGASILIRSYHGQRYAVSYHGTYFVLPMSDVRTQGRGELGHVTNFSVRHGCCSNAAEWRRPLCLTFEAELIPRRLSCFDFRDCVACRSQSQRMSSHSTA